MSSESNGFMGTLLTFLTGAAIGAGLALLYAPQSGEETRKKIKEMGDKMARDVKDNYEKISHEAQNAIDSVKSSSEKAMAHIKGLMDHEDELDDKSAKKAKAAK